MTHIVTTDIGTTDEVFAGEDKTITFTVQDDVHVAVNVSSWTFNFQLRLTRYNSTVLLSKTLGSGIAFVTNGTDGKVRVTLAQNDTKSLKAGTYYYGLARTNSGSYDVVKEGQFVLRKAAVQAP